MDTTDLHSIVRRLDRIEDGLASSAQLTTLRERALSASIETLQKEVAQLWEALEEERETTEKRVKEVSDSHLAMAKWGGALVAVTLLQIVLRKAGLG